MKLHQLLPWLDQGVKADGGGHDLADLPAAAAKTGKKRRSAAQAGVARGVKVLVEMIGKRLECSVPAAKFGHVAYIR